MRETTIRIAAGGGIVALLFASGLAGVSRLAAAGMLPPWSAVAMVAVVGAVAIGVGAAVVGLRVRRVAPDPAARGQAAAAAAPARLDRFQVEVRDAVKVLRAAEIEWIEAAGNYVRLHTGAESYLYRQPLARLEERLDPATFVRIHRSAIVNLDRIDRFDPQATGDADVALTSGRVVRLSRRYAQAFHERTGRSAGGRLAAAARGAGRG